MSTPGPLDITQFEGVLDSISLLRERRSVVELSGGTGNHTFRLQTESGGDFVVRLPKGAASDRGVDWSNEMTNVQLAAAAGVAPKVVQVDPEIGLLVTEFVDGQTLTEYDVFDAHVMVEVAALMRRLHAIDGFAGRLEMTAVYDEYRSQVRQFDLEMPSQFVEFDPQARELLRLLAEHPEPSVACHNDVNPTNILKARDCWWLVDFEYSGCGEASFDLGNFINEASVDEDAANALVDAYWDRVSLSLRARARAWSVVAAHVWVMWGARQVRLHPDRNGSVVAGGLDRYQLSTRWLAGAPFDALCRELSDR